MLLLGLCDAGKTLLFARVSGEPGAGGAAAAAAEGAPGGRAARLQRPALALSPVLGRICRHAAFLPVLAVWKFGV